MEQEDIENWLDDIAPDGTALDPDRDIEPGMVNFMVELDKINRSMLSVYVQFLTPIELPPARPGRIKSTVRKDSSSMEKRRRELAPFDKATYDRSAIWTVQYAPNAKEIAAQQASKRKLPLGLTSAIKTLKLRL